MSPRGTRAAALLGAALSLAGCFDDPVRERIELELHPGGGFTVALAVELDEPAGWRRSDARLRRRLAEHARALEEGWDARLVAIEGLGCAEQGGAWERRDGALVRFRRWARCPDAERVGDLFAGRALAVAVRSDEAHGTVELEALPLGGGPATRAERRRLEERLGAWTEAVSRYQLAVYGVAARAAEEPRLARALWEAAFGEEEEHGVAALAPADRALAAALGEALEAAAGAFAVEGSEGESLDELVRRTFDPLTETLVVTTPGPILERIGFRQTSENQVASPEGGLLRALDALRGLWLDPDPLFDFVLAVRRGEEKEFDVARYAAGDPRRAAAPPDADELRDELMRALEVPGEWRVAWRAPRRQAGG